MTKQEPVRIDLGEAGDAYAGEWADIKPRRTYRDRLAVRRESMVRGQDGTLRFEAGRGELAALDQALVAWSLGDLPACRCAEVQAGALVECPRWAVIGDVDGELGDWLYVKVAETYAGQVRTEEAKSGAVAGPAGGGA